MDDSTNIDFSIVELDSEIENLKLLRKQLNSLHTIRLEQQRKDELIHNLKERIRFLEGQQKSYDELQEQLYFHSRRANAESEKNLDAKIGVLTEQVSALKMQVSQSEEVHEATINRFKVMSRIC
jgi:hypothetical protein